MGSGRDDDDDSGWQTKTQVIKGGTKVAARTDGGEYRAAEAGGLARLRELERQADHVGMAGWLTRKFDIRLWMTRLDYLHCRVLLADTGREAPADALSFYRRAGWSGAALETYRARFGNFGKRIHAMPDRYRRIVDGERLRIGAHDWRVVVGTGHSPEHACLHCPELKLLISGDQVLPRISSNVSVHPTEPDANPMADWLASLDKLKAQVPDDVLVLPAHNEPFRGLHARLDHLAQGHHRSLARLLKTLDQPKRVIDVFGALFARAIDPAEGSMQLGLASGESIARAIHGANCVTNHRVEATMRLAGRLPRTARASERQEVCVQTSASQPPWSRSHRSAPKVTTNAPVRSGSRRRPRSAPSGSAEPSRRRSVASKSRPPKAMAATSGAIAILNTSASATAPPASSQRTGACDGAAITERSSTSGAERSTAGCVRCISSAAAETLPRRATAWKVASWRKVAFLVSGMA